MAAVAERLDSLPGARHVSLVEARSARTALVTADLRPDAADPALAALEALGVPADDVELVRLDTIVTGAGAGRSRDSSGRTCSAGRAPRRERRHAISS
jgi:hypothetical protein